MFRKASDFHCVTAGVCNHLIKSKLIIFQHLCNSLQFQGAKLAIFRVATSKNKFAPVQTDYESTHLSKFCYKLNCAQQGYIVLDLTVQQKGLKHQPDQARPAKQEFDSSQTIVKYFQN